MALRFIGIDPDTGQGNCPTVWVDEEKLEVVVQGWKVVDPLTHARCLETGDIPDHETVVRIPARMASQLTEAARVVEECSRLRAASQVG
ncbi:hypothetical protein [Streptomyces sp. RKAG337]|uniref:hypothetical protein n=1 Tax=Streptomyces sp. RKAG337 TaxID=2893404 RepID=UPI0020349970|nr:hypothetical protein [Streptomyces sp. RKAG337]MCM2430153.1 hypothetical protein [Streptomyces sp. RKAG337]